ncbi:MAG TPA: hypothetical protein EYG39_02785, partial [Rhodothermales bacterium]|nr:hypothetical protein [Rhodothermales bacterium]
MSDPDARPRFLPALDYVPDEVQEEPQTVAPEEDPSPEGERGRSRFRASLRLGMLAVGFLGMVGVVG